MPRRRQNFSAEFKFQVTLEAAKGQKTVNELASEFGVHPNRVSEWNQALLQEGAQVFATSVAQRGQVTGANTAFTSILEAADVRISMDGRGRALDNIFVERLWRCVKWEHTYLMNYDTVPEFVTGRVPFSAQMLDDAVILPTGPRGGFIPNLHTATGGYHPLLRQADTGSYLFASRGPVGGRSARRSCSRAGRYLAKFRRQS